MCAVHGPRYGRQGPSRSMRSGSIPALRPSVAVPNTKRRISLLPANQRRHRSAGSRNGSSSSTCTDRRGRSFRSPGGCWPPRGSSGSCWLPYPRQRATAPMPPSRVRDRQVPAARWRSAAGVVLRGLRPPRNPKNRCRRLRHHRSPRCRPRPRHHHLRLLRRPCTTRRHRPHRSRRCGRSPPPRSRSRSRTTGRPRARRGRTDRPSSPSLS